MSRVMPKLFREEGGATEEKGEHARLSSFLGAIAVSDLVKTTLGPKGMDKILQPINNQDKTAMKRITFTNDGATILNSLPIDNCGAKIVIEVSKTMDKEIGDGTTSVAVLTGELLREAELLINRKIHPQTIIKAWRKAVKVAQSALIQASIDNSTNNELFYQDLINIAKTTLSSKILSVNKEYFAKLAVEAVLKLNGNTDLNFISIIKKLGGKMEDSHLVDGFILPKRFGLGGRKSIKNPKILLCNTAFDNDKIKIFGAKVQVSNVDQLVEIEDEEKNKMKKKVQKIVDMGIDCIINRQLIYNYPHQLFTNNGINTIEHADFDGIERLANVLGGEICSYFDYSSEDSAAPKHEIKFGQCSEVEEIMIGEDTMVNFKGGKKGEACSVVLRGSNLQLLDEAERSLHDALCILVNSIKGKRIVFGGGNSEMIMAKEIDYYNSFMNNSDVDQNLRRNPKESIAIESFAKALRQLPTIIADNAGFDSNLLISQLRDEHYKFQYNSTHQAISQPLNTSNPSGAGSGRDNVSPMGLDMNRGIVADVTNTGLAITESLQSKLQMVISAHEAAEMILRVDDIIKTAPRQRTQDHRH